MDSSDSSAIANSPFMVAVSGHRDLHTADLPRLREAVSDFVRQLREQLPDTQLRMVVGMAQGADLLVAETAVALGVTVEALLPMPLEQYAADFEADTLECLRVLLHHPRVRCVELCRGPLDTAGAPHSAAQRDAMYANLTDTLIRRSSLLLALWDGKVSQLPGGTADTVLRYLGMRSADDPAAEPLEFVEASAEGAIAERFVYWTPAARSGDGGNPGGHTPCFLSGTGDRILHVQRAMPELLKRQLAELNNYNLEFSRVGLSDETTARGSLTSSLPPTLPPADRRLLEDIDAQYRKADALAVYYQRRSDRLFGLFAVMAFIMGAAYLMYERLTESRLLLLAYVLILLTSLVVYYLLQGRRWFGKHLTYRALAETLRARFYLRLAGADRRVDAAELLTLSGIDRFRGFGWISLVLKGIEPPDLAGEVLQEPEPGEARGIERAWIDNQYAYFTRKVARLEKSSRRVKRLRHALFFAILAVISVLFLFGDALHHVDMGLGIPLRNILTFSMGLLAVLLAVWELHQDKMATRELLWQYRNQLSHFARARAQLAALSTARRRNEVLADLGKDSLMESYLWAIHRYHREHEPPSAGGG